MEETDSDKHSSLLQYIYNHERVKHSSLLEYSNNQERKHSSLLQYRNNQERKTFYRKGPMSFEKKNSF